MQLLWLAACRFDRTNLGAYVTSDSLFGNSRLRPVGNKIDNRTRRTHPCTKTAHLALVDIDPGEIIIDLRRIKRTNLNTFSTCDTPYLAVFPNHSALVL